jgi:hypothetical protein
MAFEPPGQPAAFPSLTRRSPAFCLAASALALDPGFLIVRSCLGILALRAGSNGHAGGRVEAAK